MPKPTNSNAVAKVKSQKLPERSFAWYAKTFPKQFKEVKTAEEYFEVVEGLLRRSAVAWIKIGIYLDDARQKLGKDQFYELCFSLGLDPKATAWRYRKLARHPWLNDPKNWPYLPASQAALLLIAKHEKELTPEKLDMFVEQEALHPATEASEIKGWLPAKEKEEGYKPIGKGVALRLGGVPEGITEKDWKEFDRALAAAYKLWMQKVTGR